MIRLKNVSKMYGDVMALSRINLDIKRGEIFAIIGHSGAGKTTLLRILAMIEKPSEGEYYYNGIKVDGNEEILRKKVTMVFQKPVMFNTSVYNNIAHGLKLRGYKRGEIRKRVKEVLKLVNLEGYEKLNAKRLSGGEQQRVAIARAIIINPELLILDEPTANLDPANVIIIEKIIKEVASNGITVVLATHNLFQAKKLSDRTAHIFNGRLIEVTETDELFENPKSKITEKFITGELYF
ncbi:phosphate ABC transporter ATP-binding protein [Archaeoglobales archaeon]|nr:MAG: phosphate ABC transporter ATP-binding protein [Archaeoglobales archaeon]